MHGIFFQIRNPRDRFFIAEERPLTVTPLHYLQTIQHSVITTSTATSKHGRTLVPTRRSHSESIILTCRVYVNKPCMIQELNIAIRGNQKNNYYSNE